MKWRFESADPLKAYGVRRDLLAYLAARATADSDLGGAALIFGELVGNVVRHAPGRIVVDLHWEDDTAVLCVEDSGPGFEWGGPQLPDVLSEGGRGLFIVASTAGRLEVTPTESGGTEVRAHLPVRLAPGIAQEMASDA
jgi:anti-sigma regulatory factor (Ser/Thr protein kinase)